MAVPVYRAADRSDNVFIAVVVDVGKRDAVSFMQLARAGRSRDIHKGFPLFVAEHDVRHQSGVGRSPGAEIDIRISVVIDVAKISAHRHVDPVQRGLFGDVAKAAVPEVPV